MKLGATAGLRFLPGNKSDKILEAVRKFLQTTPFIMDPEEGVSILDGDFLSLDLTGLQSCL